MGLPTRARGTRPSCALPWHVGMLLHPLRRVCGVEGGHRRPRWVVKDCSKGDKYMFRTLVKILGCALAMLSMGCTASRPPGTVAMTCSSASYHTYSGMVHSGITVRHICTEVTGPDGKAVAVRLRDTKVGTTVYCTDKGGKLSCPDVALAVLDPRFPHPVPAGSPGFVFPPIPPAPGGGGTP